MLRENYTFLYYRTIFLYKKAKKRPGGPHHGKFIEGEKNNAGGQKREVAFAPFWYYSENDSRKEKTMKLLKNVLWQWWEIGLVKWSSALFGLAVGAYWPEVFAPYALPIVLVSLILGSVALFYWLKK